MICAFTMEITKDTIIGECISEHPETAEVLVGRGLHCVGCFAAGFETLEAGLKMHGKTDKEVEGVIKQLNELIRKTKDK